MRAKRWSRTGGALGSSLLLLAVLSLVGLAASSGQELGLGLKANLDLPVNAGAGSEDEDEDAPEVILFYGSQYEATAICFALDESGSMKSEGRWQLQTREVTRAINQLSTTAEFSVVYYGSNVTIFRNRPVSASSANKAAGISFIQSRNPNGDTCIGEGTTKALQIVRRSGSSHRAVIVTSDGRPDVCATGNRASPSEQQRILQQTLAANPGLGVQVHTIFVGRSNDPDAISFMRRLARAHSGTFRVVTQ